jgi:hypothetical protein
VVHRPPVIIGVDHRGTHSNRVQTRNDLLPHPKRLPSPRHARCRCDSRSRMTINFTKRHESCEAVTNQTVPQGGTGQWQRFCEFMLEALTPDHRDGSDPSRRASPRHPRTKSGRSVPAAPRRLETVRFTPYRK